MNLPAEIEKLSISGFDYDLPDQRVAKYPLEQRDRSKLLLWKKGSIEDRRFTDLPGLLPPRSKLIFNNTRVIRARLHFRKTSGALIELFVLDPHDPADYTQSFQQTNTCTWKCMVGNLKKWKEGPLFLSIQIKEKELLLKAEKTGKTGNSQLIRFSWNHEEFTFSEVLDAAGKLPIPPYLHRETEDIDLTRYQTVFSKIEGSVAAPTAGLHFTDEVLELLSKNEITTAELTLHVGAGTFQPVKSETIGLHEMHTEHMLIDKSLIEELIGHKNQLIAVGTTSVRTLESLYWMGSKVLKQPDLSIAGLAVTQWEPYHTSTAISRHEALEALLAYLSRQNARQLYSATSIIIVPGYTFRMIDGMITNFHQPQSTLLLLISAFIGDEWKKVYQHALENNYRFLSYGDSNLYMKE
ncbi:S-adenosylmethionine:tRNA ribosyltransferase-isomerase [Roseimarinus sediminis]|uniref:S-adenosylmethionine:tRNA ribosyltransferase-isomerase n=1 Tax=Roseimarinus sediminis TaxID=1610899 RepID=UPI003D1D4251